MAEQSETPRILDELSKSNNAKTGGRATRQQQTARRRFAIILSLFLPLLLGLAYLGFMYWQMQQQLGDMLAENQQLLSRQQVQSNRLQELQALAVEVEQVASVDESELQTMEQRLEDEIQRFQAELQLLRNEPRQARAAPESDWLLREASFSLGLANQKLLFQGEVPGAIDLLVAADRALQESGSANVISARQSIAVDIQSLREIELPDTEGIFIRLDTLNQQIESIDLLASMRENFDNRRNRESRPLPQGESQRGWLDAGMEFLGSIFVWRQCDEDLGPLAPGQDGLIRQNLRLYIEQAQLALLRRNQQLYSTSLQSFLASFRKYALTESEAGQQILADINELGSLSIEVNLPSLERSIQIVDELVATTR